MNMPESYLSTFTIRGASREDVRGYEHCVWVLLPYRRYRRDGRPVAAAGSPSLIQVGDRTWHGPVSDPDQ